MTAGGIGVGGDPQCPTPGNFLMVFFFFQQSCMGAVTLHMSSPHGTKGGIRKDVRDLTGVYPALLQLTSTK
jgi:hypothetical protein